VFQTPKGMLNSGDPQLERTVAEALRMLKSYVPPEKPKYKPPTKR